MWYLTQLSLLLLFVCGTYGEGIDCDDLNKIDVKYLDRLVNNCKGKILRAQKAGVYLDISNISNTNLLKLFKAKQLAVPVLVKNSYLNTLDFSQVKEFASNNSDWILDIQGNDNLADIKFHRDLSWFGTKDKPQKVILLRNRKLNQHAYDFIKLRTDPELFEGDQDTTSKLNPTQEENKQQKDLKNPGPSNYLVSEEDDIAMATTVVLIIIVLMIAIAMVAVPLIICFLKKKAKHQEMVVWSEQNAVDSSSSESFFDQNE